MEKLLLVLLALFVVAFISVKSHSIGCGHGHGYHGGHHGGHHVDFVSLGSPTDAFKGRSDNGGFKGGLAGQSGYEGFHGDYRGNFADQIGYSGIDSGYHRALGGHQGNFGGQGGTGRLPTAHQGNLGGQGGLGRLPTAHQSNSGGYPAISRDQGQGYQVSFRGQGGYQSSAAGQPRTLGSQDILAGSTAGQRVGLGDHPVNLGANGGSRGLGYKGGLGGVHQSSYGAHQGSVGDQNNLGTSTGFESKGGLGRSRSQSVYGGYDADHGGFGAHGGYIIQGY